MNKVYIVVGGVDYEGETTLDIYSDEAKAVAKVEELEARATEEWTYDYYGYDEFEVK
jgi:hypothetical protein